MKSRFARRLILFIFTVVLLPHSIAFGRILDKWDHPDAYKPSPILFLHGFATGNPNSWDDVVNGTNDPKGLKEYFDKYAPVTSNLDLSKPYLERLAFNDPNGSIDTYPDGRRGWADKVRDRVSKLLDLYRFKNSSLRINLVCHSMGGLAAREYVTNPKYGNSYLNIDKIITIGTPHAGTPIANVKKIESAIAAENKYIWEVPYYGKTRVIQEAYEINYTIKLVRGTYKIDLEGEAIKDMAVGSPFLMNLNRPFSNNIKKLAIYGEANSFIFQRLNANFFYLYYPNEPFTCGDGIVPRDSQKGYDIMSDYPSKAYWVWTPDKIEGVEADHITELESKETVQKILSFLDSTKPVLEITYPGPGTTEIYETSIHIQGKVYKEYLPADSILHLRVTKAADNTVILDEGRPNSIKPSDLWILNNPDSPVAEFDEAVDLPGNGTYKITLQAINPAGVKSELKSVFVTVEELSLRIATIYLSVPTVNIHLVRKIIDRDGEFNFVKDYTRLGWEIHTPPDPMADYYWKTGAFYINQLGIITVGAAYYIPLPGPPPHSLTIRTAEPSCTPCPPDGYRIPTSYYTSEAELDLGICSGMLTGTINSNNADFNIKEPSSTTTCPYVSSSIIGRQEDYKGTYAGSQYTGTFQGSRGLTVQMEGVNPDKENCPVMLYETIDYSYNGDFIMYVR